METTRRHGTRLRSGRIVGALAGALLLGGIASGCARAPLNRPLNGADPANGYYFDNHRRPPNSDETLFIVAFSGGGTRAAALAAGVLKELADTRFPGPDGPRRLLDEVDGISAVSGGSITAAAFGLYGDEAFELLDRGFLKRNIQKTLVRRTLNPFRWPSLWSRRYGRSDLAADYYDEVLFRGATFADLKGRPSPYLAINATDLTTGARFDFTQYQFDLLGSDLSDYRISRAVAASSAVPAVLTPITLRNYAHLSDRPPAAWITNHDSGHLARTRLRARELRSYLDATNRPFVHLVDGGVSDNLGLRAALDALVTIEATPPAARRVDLTRVRRLVILSAYAYSSPERDWDRRPHPPSSLAVGTAAASHTLDRFSFETLELIRDQFSQWKSRRGDLGEIELYPIFINFTNFRNPEERRFFLNLPTSFFLPNQQVDLLKEAGHRLLRQSPEYRRLLQDLGAPLPRLPGGSDADLPGSTAETPDPVP